MFLSKEIFVYYSCLATSCLPSGRRLDLFVYIKYVNMVSKLLQAGGLELFILF